MIETCKNKLTNSGWKSINQLFVVTFGNINQTALKESILADDFSLIDYKDYFHPKMIHSDVFLLISDSDHVKDLDIFIKKYMTYFDIVLLPLIPEECNLETGAVRYNENNFYALVKTVSRFLNKIKLNPMGTDSAFNSFQYQPHKIYVAEKKWDEKLTYITASPKEKIHEIWIFYNFTLLENIDCSLLELEEIVKSINEEICNYDIKKYLVEGIEEKDRFLIFIN